VFAGSHHAGVTSGGGNAQKQNLNIADLARAALRFLDLRVAAFSTGATVHGGKQTAIKAFHADGKLQLRDNKVRSVAGFTGIREIQRSKFRAGAEGLALLDMLDDARNFVTSADYLGEFLILKFEKFTNWALIADLWRANLGNALYRGSGNVNTKILAQLAGKVIFTLMSDGYAQLALAEGRPPADYDANFSGQQYCGAGGTSAISGKSHKAKIKENARKQAKILAVPAPGCREYALPLIEQRGKRAIRHRRKPCQIRCRWVR